LTHYKPARPTLATVICFYEIALILLALLGRSFDNWLRFAPMGGYYYSVSDAQGNVLGTFPFTISGVGYGRIAANPTITKAIMEPTATTPGVSSLNGVINPTLLPGADLGAQVKAAIAILNGTCGEIAIPNGTSYVWSTPAVIMLPCQRLTGRAVVNVAPMRSPFLIMAASVNLNNPTLYKNGGVDELTFVGPGTVNDTAGTNWTPAQRTQPGLMIGGDPANVLTPAGYLAFITNMHDIHIRGFGCGISFANGFQISTVGGIVEGNFNGVCFNNSIGLEDINFYGTQILNNINNGIYQPSSSAFVELDLTSVSLDYNGQAFTGGRAISLTQTSLNITGGHFEGPLQASQVAAAGHVTVKGSRFNFVNSRTYNELNSVFLIRGTNSFADISDVEVGSPFAFPAPIGVGKIDYLVNWQSLGNSNHLFVGPYVSSNASGVKPTIPPSALGANIQYYTLPTFDNSGDITGWLTNQQTMQRLVVNNGVSARVGFQAVRSFPGCITAAALGATCSTAPVVWPFPIPDGNYTPVCSLQSSTGVPSIRSTTVNSAGATIVTIIANSAAAAGGTVNCIEIHD